MAKKEHVDRRFTQDVHIRLTEAEAKRLQKRADELGTTLSKAGRMLMFKRAETPAVFTEREGRQAIAQGINSLKTSFKKVNSDVARFVAGYEQSLTIKNRAGEPAVSTEQTIRTAESIVYNQMRLQDGLNEIIRHFGGTEVHLAAKPAAGTVVGDRMMGRSAPEQESPKKQNTESARSEATQEKIPFEFRHMANTTIYATIVSEPETYMNGKYEMIRIVAQVEEKNGGASSFYRIDCTDFKKRYEKLSEYLKPERKILVAGDLRFSVGVYNGARSESVATIIMSQLTLL